MKYKKVILIATLFSIVCGVAYCSTQSSNSTESGVKLTGVKVDNTNNIDFSHFNWLKQYPQLSNIESNGQTAMIDKLRTSESISQLIGPINNPYGVRDDILDYIIHNIPPDNPKLLQAAIASEFFDNLALYSISNQDKLMYVRKENLAVHCMYLASDDSPHQLRKKIESIQRNTPARSAYINNISSTVFGWQMLGSGYGSNTEDEMCKTGDYLK